MLNSESIKEYAPDLQDGSISMLTISWLRFNSRFENNPIDIDPAWGCQSPKWNQKIRIDSLLNLLYENATLSAQVPRGTLEDLAWASLMSARELPKVWNLGNSGNSTGNSR